jgi:hypothetical protein
MTRNGAHIIQKRDLLEMLSRVPDAEHVAIAFDGQFTKVDLGGEMDELKEAREEYRKEAGKAEPSFERLAELADKLIDELESRLTYIEGEVEDFDRGVDRGAIERVARCGHSGVTHIICSI